MTRITLISAFLCLTFLFLNCKKDSTQNYTLKDVGGTWVATEVFWDGVDQSANTENTLILTAELKYGIIEVPVQFPRYQDGGTYSLTNQGNTLSFVSTGTMGLTSANIKSVDTSYMVLEYTRIYRDIDNNLITVQIKSTYKKQ